MIPVSQRSRCSLCFVPILEKFTSESDTVRLVFERVVGKYLSVCNPTLRTPRLDNWWRLKIEGNGKLLTLVVELNVPPTAPRTAFGAHNAERGTWIMNER